MNTYIYDAALYCEDCARKIRDEHNAYGIIDTDNSDDYPQGPYANGGGESDSPEHCDCCHVFLENPLTEDGYDYVKDVVSEQNDNEIVAKWAEFYVISN